MYEVSSNSNTGQILTESFGRTNQLTGKSKREKNNLDDGDDDDYYYDSGCNGDNGTERREREREKKHEEIFTDEEGGSKSQILWPFVCNMLSIDACMVVQVSAWMNEWMEWNEIEYQTKTLDRWEVNLSDNQLMNVWSD